MSQVNNFACCGIKELANISTDRSPRESIIQLCQQFDRHHASYPRGISPRWRPHAAYVIFSEAGPAEGPGAVDYARKLAAYIEKENLGKVLPLQPKMNPNSRRTLRPFVWHIKPVLLKKWWTKNYTSAALWRI